MKRRIKAASGAWAGRMWMWMVKMMCSAGWIVDRSLTKMRWLRQHLWWIHDGRGFAK